jgi:hypothetical protein
MSNAEVKIEDLRSLHFSIQRSEFLLACLDLVFGELGDHVFG